MEVDYIINFFLKGVYEGRSELKSAVDLWNFANEAIQKTREEYNDNLNKNVFLDMATEEFKIRINKEYDVKLDKDLKNFEEYCQKNKNKIMWLEFAKELESRVK